MSRSHPHRGEKPGQTFASETNRYEVAGDKTTSGAVPIPMPVIDYGAIRQAKLKCQDCGRCRFGTCFRNPVGCASWTPLRVIDDKSDVSHFAWARVGSIADGGHGGGR